MKILHCMFDFDGTLFDTFDDILRNLKLAFAKNGIPQQSMRIEAMMQLQLRDAVATCVPGIPPERLDAVIADFKDGYDSSDYPATRIKTGAIETLDGLRSRRIGMSIVSNKRRTPMLRILEKFGITGYFGGIYNPDMFADGIKRLKPGLMAYALERMRLSCDGTVYIGDSEIDVLSAEENGLVSIIVANGYGKTEHFRSAPTYTIQNLTEILPLIGS